MAAPAFSRFVSMLRGPEAGVVAWGAVTFAALLASTFVLRPVRDSLVVEGDLAFVPWLFTATFTVTLLLAPAWGKLVATSHRRRFVAIAYHVSAAIAVGFAILVATGFEREAVSYAFYVWHAVNNLFVVSVLWSVCADSLGPARARRLYGPIAVGGTIGTIVGPLLAKLLVDDVGTHGLLVVCAGFVELAIFSVAMLDRAARRLDATRPDDVDVQAIADAPVAGHALDGLRDLGRSRYLVGISVYVVFTATAATFVYMEQLGITKVAFAARDVRTEYLATMELWTNVVTLSLQALLAAPLLRWVGPGLVLAILPLVQAGSLIAILVAPSLSTLLVVQVVARSTTHGLTRPARELLFTVVSREQKYRAKNVIDTLIYRFGDVSASWLNYGLVAAGFGGTALLAFSLPMAGAWIATAAILGLAFRRRTRAQT